MTKTAAGRTAVKEPLGFEVELTRAQVQAEHVAKIQEEIEDRRESLRRDLEKLLEDMRTHKGTSLKAKAPGGTLYRFEAVNLGEKVRITRA